MDTCLRRCDGVVVVCLPFVIPASRSSFLRRQESIRQSDGHLLRRCDGVVQSFPNRSAEAEPTGDKSSLFLLVGLRPDVSQRRL